MKRLSFLIAALVIGLSATTAAAPPATAGSGGPTNWPALLNCSDVNGDGTVVIGDIVAVVGKFGTSVVMDTDGEFVPGPGYMLLYDLDGGGFVGIGDILTAVADFGSSCPLVESQVARATLATAPYQNLTAAANAGYGIGSATQYVSQMGIHVNTGIYNVPFDPETPIGLIYKETPSGGEDELIGLWYIVPVQDVCDVFDPGATCSNAEPEGFAGPEDNTDLNAFQRGWHTHENLCFIPGPPAIVTELGSGGSHQQCKDAGGIVNFGTYGYMVHLYNFIPNAAGRFMMWNTENLP